MLLLALACTPEEAAPPPVDPCDEQGEVRLAVVQTLLFVRLEGDGVSDGFDLDGSGSAEGCGVPDLVAPDGRTGIDNAFGYLLPALELTEAKAVEGLIQASIASGELLLSMEVAEVDDPLDDACVDLAVGRALGAPILGTDGKLLSGQTFDPDPAFPRIEVADLALVDGSATAPIVLEVPVEIFDVALQFELAEGQVRVELHEDGTMTGIFGGGLDVDYLLSIAREENVDPDLAGVLEGLLAAWADLEPDEEGQCTHLSLHFWFEAVPAFWY